MLSSIETLYRHKARFPFERKLTCVLYVVVRDRVKKEEKGKKRKTTRRKIFECNLTFSKI